MHRTLILTLLAAATATALAACSTAGSSAPPPPSGVAGAPGTAGGPASGSAGALAGGGGGTAGSAVTDPCTLLTQAEVTAAVGKPVGPGSTADNPNSCDFGYPANDVPDVQAGVDFIDGSLDEYCSDTGASAVGMTIEPVGGLGDGACFIHVGSLRVGSSLTFSKNGRLFQTFADLGSTSSIDDIKAADTTLAKDVLARL